MNLSQLKQLVISELYKAVQQKDYEAAEFLSKVYQRVCSCNDTL